MTEDVLTFNDDTPVREAIATLEDYGISGAPVINASEECVGVFSRADIVQHEVEMEAREAPRPGDFFGGERNEDFNEFIPKSDYDEVLLGGETMVGEWMSPEIQAVPPSATVADIARDMAENGLRRILVMEEKKLLGIITTGDIVRLVGGLGPAGKPAKKARAHRPR